VARTTERTLTVVADPDDDLATLAQLRRLHARPLGRVLCEPHPTTNIAGLAHHLLAALGKTIDPSAPSSAPPWQLVETHLRAEHTHHVFLLRGHTLTYNALRQITDTCHAAHARLWLFVHQDPPGLAVRQLTEALPHDTTDTTTFLDHWRHHIPDDSDTDPSPPAGDTNYPYIQPASYLDPRPNTLSAIASGLTRPQRTVIRGTWQTSRDWITERLAPSTSHQQGADLILKLARAGRTASEIRVRVHAAAHEIDKRYRVHTHLGHVTGEAVPREEIYPCQYNHEIQLLAQLADAQADPHTATLIILAGLSKDLYTLRQANLSSLAADGTVYIRCGLTAIPPELRPPLIAYHQLRTQHAERHHPLLPGNNHGRMNRPAMRRILHALDAPNSTWEHNTQDPYDWLLDDGTAILNSITPIRLWPPDDD
jgi:hypothetical protein